jgi:hypothetical protein
MTIYRSNRHRSIYENHFGPIPKDEFGRSMEIHHKDGNHENNDISNLELVTLQKHFEIHFSQGDYGACLIMSKRMELSPEEKSKLAKRNVAKQIANGKNRFTDAEWQRQNQLKRVEDGTHHLLGGSIQRKYVSDGKHHFLGGKIQSNTQMKLLAEGKHISQFKILCSHCGKSFNKGNYANWHGDKCKLKKS